MSLSTLNIKNFRNIIDLNFSPGPKFNLIVGDNGAGKTSLLEGIYYLGTGRSFRTHINRRIIHHNATAFSLHANTQGSHHTISLGIQRSINGARQIRIDGVDISSIAIIAEQLPLQILTTSSYRFFHDGPKLRRQVLDWGVFHVKQEFLSYWKYFQKALLQRNAAIKARRSIYEITSWDQQFCEYGSKIHQLRKEYVEQLTPFIHNLLTTLMPDIPTLSVQYYPGWNKQESLIEAIEKNHQQDLQQGYTQVGPQRADFQILYESTPIKDFLSQGQQKLAIYALLCSQGMLLSEISDKKPIYLIDDLPSELDQSRQEAVLQILEEIENQIFITSIQSESLPNRLLKNSSLFHMKQGAIIN